MAKTDFEKLQVQIEANIRNFEKEMAKAVGITNRMAKGVETRARGMQRNLDGIMKRAGQSLVNPLAGIGGGLLAGFGVREVAAYADAWTVAGNKIAAAGEIAGREGRSLEGINEIARKSRTGITETSDLYAKLLRSTARVADSELDVARATEIVNKAFKAGGAATSEQIAGILQLSQALGSGILQGDELRSVRENAPLLAQAIADEFETTIAGLKELGAEGKITSERVFKAILKAQDGIEAAFARTNPTIRDGITAVNNAMTQYIGQTDDSLSASQRLVGGLTALADNFDTVADVTLQVAGVIAGALLGRSIVGMIAKVPLAAAAIRQLAAAMRLAGAAGGTMAGVRVGLAGATAAAGPVGLALGAVAATSVLLASSNESAAERTERLKEELRDLGLISDSTAPKIDALGNQIDEIAPEQTRRKLREVGDELERLRSFGTQSLIGLVPDDLGAASIVDLIAKIKALQDVSIVESIFGTGPTDADQKVLSQLETISQQLVSTEIDAKTFIDRLNEISKTDVSPNVDNLITALREAAEYQDALIKRRSQLDQTGKITAFEDIQKDIDAIKTGKLQETVDALRDMQISLQGRGQGELAAKVAEMVEQLQRGETQGSDVVAKLQEIARQNVNQPIAALIESIISAIGQMDVLIGKQKELANTSAGAVSGPVPIDPSIRGRQEQNFFQARDLELSESELEKSIQELALKIKEAATEAGVVISDGLARQRAILELGNKDLDGAIKGFVDRVVGAESGGDRFAKNPKSSATGLGQFIESTWIRLFRENFPDRAEGLSRAAILALRTDAQTSRELIEAYARENAAVLKQAGVSVSEASLQLAHFLGPGGATKVLQAAPGTPIQGLLDQQAINANPSILGGGATVDDVIRYAQARAGLTGEIQRQTQAVDELNASATAENSTLEIERQAMTMNTFEAEKLRKEHELLNELRQQGVTITPQISAAVSELATKYAQEKTAIEGINQAQQRAAQSAQELAESQRRAAEASSQMGQEFANAFAGAIKGFISDLVHGKSATEALTNAVQRLADQLLDIVLNNLFKSILSGAAGGGIGGGGGLFAGLFHKGALSAGTNGPGRRVSAANFIGAERYHKGGFAGLRPGEIPAILRRGEPIGPEAVDAAARRMLAIDSRRSNNTTSDGPPINLTTKVVNRFDSGSFLSESLATAAGEKAVLNFVRARPAAFRAAIQG